MSQERLANSVDERIGKRVKSRRLEVDLSQEKLADLYLKHLWTQEPPQGRV